jgi:hypothetical protein
LIGGVHLELLGNDELLGYAIVSLPFWEVYQRKGSRQEGVFKGYTAYF